eukprot:m51a1_g4480 hypothetical protein (277) ;mRNA; r:265764-267301
MASDARPEAERAAEEHLASVHKHAEFGCSIASLSILWCLTDRTSLLPLSFLDSLLDDKDVLPLLMGLMERPPWVHRGERWNDGDEAHVTKIEAQLWLLYNLLVDPACRSKITWNSSKKTRYSMFVHFPLASEASILWCLTDHTSLLPLSFLDSLLDDKDVLPLLMGLMERPPWVHRGESGGRERWNDGDEARVTKIEAQLWLLLYNLLVDPACRSKITWNSSKKTRYSTALGELAIFNAPPATSVPRSVVVSSGSAATSDALVRKAASEEKGRVTL